MFQRIQNTPVLANHNQGGGTIGGLQADAVAAPAACWNGTNWAMNVSIWNIAAGTWSSAFFTSPDLVTWTYVIGSLVHPSGSDYILGNSGLAWFGGKYYWAYSHYPSAAPLTAKIALAYSSNLTTWTIVGDPLIASPVYEDPALVVNPTSGKLELWGWNGSPIKIIMADSPDGVTWTDHSSTPNVTSPVWVYSNLGEPQPWYYNGMRFLTCDTILTSGGPRTTSLFYWNSAVPVVYPSVLTPVASNAWESVQVFDACCVGPYDRGDGRGQQFWMLYAGGDNAGTTDNTDSCIGLAYGPLITSVPSGNGTPSSVLL